MVIYYNKHIKEKEWHVDRAFVLAIIVLFFVVFFIIYHFSWRNFNDRFLSVATSESLIQTSAVSDYLFSSNYRYRKYHDIFDNEYQYFIEMPKQYQYRGYISVLDKSDDYHIEFTHWMSRGPNYWPGKSFYSLRIGEIDNKMRMYSSEIDINGHPIINSYDSDEYIEEWNRLYEKYNDKINLMLNIVDIVFYLN
ncbi:MAG: hypothetical protein LBC96_07335 [Lachnospiraceae bacterium]|jgi:hypothetical protein|nr:hypothetical protein [Lachnospiraceae bacterium]